MSEDVLLSIGDGIAEVRFNRPEALNAINESLANQFLSHCREIAQREDVRAVVLSGEGRGFMAGGDVACMRDANPQADKVIESLVDAIHPALLILADLTAPVLASLHGPVAGAGAGIAFAVDLAIAADNTRISLAYSGIGATPDAASTWTLPRLVGIRKAMEMSMLPRTVDAAEALRLGLVNAVVPLTALREETQILARQLAAGPTRAYGCIKRLLRDSFNRTPAQQMDAEKTALCQTTRSADFLEGISAFVGKRPPKFVGR